MSGLIVFPVMLLLNNLHTSAQSGPILKWEPVPGAGGYYIEVRNSQKKIIAESELKVTEFDISKLSTGNYQYRLTTLNKLKRKGNSTGWINLSIEKAVTPALSKVSRKIISHSFNNPPIIVSGENFLQDTKLYLKKDNNRIPLGTSYISGSELKAVFISDSRVTGLYDVLAVNRGGFEAVLPGAVEIIDPDVPVLETISAVKIYNSVETGIVVKGRNLTGELELTVSDDKGRVIPVIKRSISDTEIAIMLKPGHTDNGIYDITAVKRNYFPSAGKIRVEVVDPPLPELMSVSSNKIYNSIETSLVVKGRNLGTDVKLIVEDAGGGRIPLKQQNVSDNEIVITLVPGRENRGNYTLTAVKYDFYKSAAKFAIEIAEPDLPVMESLSQNTFYSGDEITLVIKGKNFGRDTVLQIENSRGENITFEQKTGSDSEISIHFLQGLQEKGEYAVSAVKNNIFKSADKLKFNVIEQESVKLVSVVPGSVTISKGRFSLRINGDNFDKKTEFLLRGNGVVLKPQDTSIEKRSAVIYFNEEKYQGGKYAVVSGKKLSPPVIIEKGFKITDPSKGLIGLNVLSISAGLDCNFLHGDWSSKLDSSLKGFHLSLSYPLSYAPLIKNIPFLRSCGLETLVSYSGYEFLDKTNTKDFSKTSFYAGLNYPVTLGFIDYNLSLVFKADAGSAYTSMGVITDEVTSLYTSIDPAVKGGIALRYEWMNYFFTDLSAEYGRVFYISHPLDEAGISLSFGVKL